MENGSAGGSLPSPQDSPFGCPICLDTLKDPVTIPCGHNFCLGCLGAHRHRPGAGAGGGQGAPRCPLCQEPFPADLQLRKNHTLCELLQLRQPPPRARSPMAPPAPPEEEAPGPSEPGGAPQRQEPEAAQEDGVLCDVCPEGERATAAQSCLVCLASFCPPHLQPHLRSPAFQGHRLVPPLRRIEDSLCKLHLRPLESFCRTDQTCICQLCQGQEHRSHEVVAVEVEREHKEAQRPKILSCVENQLDELGVTVAQTRKTVELIKEFQTLKIAAEEKSSLCPSFQKELSFTKSSQAVCAVKELLVTACKNQWDQLLGKGYEESGFHGMQEAVAEPQPSDKSNNPACLETRDYFLKFAFIIDLDSDTADKFLQMFGTKGAKRVLTPIGYPESPTRFINCEQVLGENLMNRGNYYWEVEIIDGWVSIGVIAEGFNPRESYDRGRLGRNEKSCCLQWNGQNYVAWFGGFESVIQQPFFHTIGVYLEYSEKALTFYGVRDTKMTCLQQLKVARFKKGQFDPFQNKINHQFPSLFAYNLKPAFFLESVDAHMQIGPLKKDCVSVLKRR
ncbi:E3 ubiquitin-protein ligase TRIM47 isoform X2 [Trachemys scripta elegans]|uniref:E3 ubiquitin-protein ligase TRIM47 isoform X2 n=1 Tax=Trachemys scripta elegans TaxID=31138 RepID=UPI001557EF93|nr:E3 ubiquitin-protein ligase TRIM47 isoform X2 [Trachemys scripta elegans]